MPKLRALTLLVFIVCLSISSARASEADAILGVWWTPTMDGQFEIYVKEGRYFGKITGDDNPDLLDSNNPDPDLRDRLVVGIDFLKDFAYNERRAEWVDGKIYDPNDGRTYDCKMWLDKDDPSKLNARGFLGVSFLGRTEVFTRTAPEDVIQPAS